LYFHLDSFSNRNNEIGFDSTYIRELTKHINLFCEQYRQDFDRLDSLEELDDQLGFCAEQLAFWIERNNPEKYVESLRSLLAWLFDKVEESF
jgi:hypothetical protein